MKQIAVWCVVVAGLLGAARNSIAQVIGGVVSQEEAIRHGLMRAWYLQSDVSPTTGNVVDATLQDGALFVQTNRGAIAGD